MVTVRRVLPIGTSRLVILRCRRPRSGTIATSQLDQHVPQGFHGNFAAMKR